MAKSSDFNRVLLARTVEAAIGPSSLRNQGSKCVIERARDYLRGLDYHRFVSNKRQDFDNELNIHTNQLKHFFPKGARHWGSARKALNLVLRDILYNKYLDKQYHFHRIEKWLELPLDSYVAKALRMRMKNKIPKWIGVIHLKPEENSIFQNAAREMAREMDLNPIHLDIYLWREMERKRK